MRSTEEVTKSCFSPGLDLGGSGLSPDLGLIWPCFIDVVLTQFSPGLILGYHI